jgi:hypothetical protein
VSTVELERFRPELQLAGLEGLVTRRVQAAPRCGGKAAALNVIGYGGAITNNTGNMKNV